MTIRVGTQPPKAITVVAFLVAALIPASVVATIQNQFAWYHGLALFYGALGSAEIAYLAALHRAQRFPPFRLIP